MEIDPVTRFVVRCTVEGCTWQQEHKTHGNAEMDGARHEAEWHGGQEGVKSDDD